MKRNDTTSHTYITLLVMVKVCGEISLKPSAIKATTHVCYRLAFYINLIYGKNLK
jgi:hypothetical protein